MKIFTWDDILQLESNPNKSNFFKNGCALTVGSFDGPHLGHKKIFEVVKNAGIAKNFKSGVLTFKSPLSGLKKSENYVGDISTLSQRIDFFEKFGLDFAVVIDFSDKFSKIEGSVFLRQLVNSMELKFLAEGQDFHCGFKGSTGISEINILSKKLGFEFQVVEPILFGDERVSSSRIRKSILNGDFNSVRLMLNRNYKVDCSTFDFETSTEKNAQILSIKKDFVKQVLPDLKSGCERQFNVLVKSPEKSVETKMILEDQNLRLVVPISEKVSPKKIQAIEFIE